MKLALIYDKNDHKLTPEAYSQCYRYQFLALQKVYDEVIHITEECDILDVDADVIIFYDVHCITPDVLYNIQPIDATLP